MSKPVVVRDELPEVHLHDCRETFFFSEEHGRLVQWIEVDISCTVYPTNLTLEIRTGRKSARRTVEVHPPSPGRTLTVRAHAPLRWPRPPDADARLLIRSGKRTIEARITMGSHRPWTFYLLSDLCADDAWAYCDLAAHDRNDYLTTLAELKAGPDNRYNLATVYQAERFFRQATSVQRSALKRALRDGRVYMTPIPNQLNCGLFVLSVYPLLLEPFRKWCTYSAIPPDRWTRDAYHMEAPTWTNGLVNLLACAGFRSFGKSLLQYQAPWIDTLRTLPRLTRLEVSPHRFVYLLLRCGGYTEGERLLGGPPNVNRFLHEQKIPEHEGWGAEYPTSAIPLVGMYGDLSPKSKDLAAAKIDAVRAYNSQGWTFPRLLNATWREFFDHVERELGPADRPKRGAALRAVRGGTGASWEAWVLTVQAEAARLRKLQRDVASVHALHAMSRKVSSAAARRLEEMTMEMVALGDHAWNGSSDGSRKLNLAIRRRRLTKAEKHVDAFRRGISKGISLRAGGRMAAVNTLGWARTCRVNLPSHVRGKDVHLLDTETGERLAIRDDGAPPWASVRNVPAFGARVLEVRAGGVPAGVEPFDPTACPIPLDGMRPLLQVDGKELTPRGGWKKPGLGTWRTGPFTIRAVLGRIIGERGAELRLTVRGTPPAKPYELRWAFEAPWKRCVWRGESGGGFVTPGPPEKGGDSLLGIAGSIFAAGEGLSAAAPRGRTRIDFAFDESGMCGLGGPTTRAAKGTYHEAPDSAALRRSVMRSTTTAPHLEWYLLADAQNFREAFRDQGGAREWAFRCGMRVRKSPFDDADLYRFAAGFNRPGELVNPRALDAGDTPWLNVSGKRVLILAVRREGRSVIVDLFNTSARRRTITLTARLASHRRITLTDMLTRPISSCPRGRITIAAKAFARVVIA